MDIFAFIDSNNIKLCTIKIDFCTICNMESMYFCQFCKHDSNSKMNIIFATNYSTYVIRDPLGNRITFNSSLR